MFSLSFFLHELINRLQSCLEIEKTFDIKAIANVSASVNKTLKSQGYLDLILNFLSFNQTAQYFIVFILDSKHSAEAEYIFRRGL